MSALSGPARPSLTRARLCLRAGAVVPLPLVVDLAGACENTFEATSDDGPPCSICGMMDAAGDTQWLRVSPLRSAVLASPDPTGVQLTLRDTATGQIIMLRDSAVSYGTFTAGRTTEHTAQVQP